MKSQHTNSQLNYVVTLIITTSYFGVNIQTIINEIFTEMLRFLITCSTAYVMNFAH